jgi:hypothetical protein
MKRDFPVKQQPLHEIVPLSMSSLMLRTALFSAHRGVPHYADIIFTALYAIRANSVDLRASHSLRLYLEGSYADAKEMIEQVLLEHPKHETARSTQVLIYYRSKDPRWESLASKLLEEGKEMGPKAVVKAILAEANPTQAKRSSSRNVHLPS